MTVDPREPAWGLLSHGWFEDAPVTGTGIEADRVRAMKSEEAAARQHPWAVAAVCVMVTALTLLLFGLTQVPLFQMVPGYAAAYLLIGLCIFGPLGKLPLLRQTAVFVLPGVLLVAVALLDLGLWAGGWLLGLPAWGILVSRWTPGNAFRVGRVLMFLGLLGLGLAAFTLNMIYPILIPGLFLLPLIPLVRPAFPAYRVGLPQGSVEALLGISLLLPSPFRPLKVRGHRPGPMPVGLPPSACCFRTGPGAPNAHGPWRRRTVFRAERRLLPENRD